MLARIDLFPLYHYIYDLNSAEGSVQIMYPLAKSLRSSAKLKRKPLIVAYFLVIYYYRNDVSINISRFVFMTVQHLYRWRPTCNIQNGLLILPKTCSFSILLHQQITRRNEDPNFRSENL